MQDRILDKGKLQSQRIDQVVHFFRGSFSNGENLRAPIQFRRRMLIHAS